MTVTPHPYWQTPILYGFLAVTNRQTQQFPKDASTYEDPVRLLPGFLVHQKDVDP